MAKWCSCRPCHRHEASPLVPITILLERHRWRRWVGNLENLINHSLRRTVLGLGPNIDAIRLSSLLLAPPPPHSHASFFVADAEAGDAADKQPRLGSAENKVRSNFGSGRLHNCLISCL